MMLKKMHTYEAKLAQHKNKLRQRFNLSEEEVMLGVVKNFDFDKYHHADVTSKLVMYYIHDVDVKLAPLLERMNGFQNEPITRMSCQYNGLGLASIEFTYWVF